jgi:hypothetical protein
MAVIFADGFDYYQGGISSLVFTGDMGKRWTTVGGTSGSITIGPAYSRMPSGQGALFTGASSCYVLKSFGSNYTAGCLGFAINFVSSNVSRVLATITDSNSEQISIRTNASGVLVVNRGSTLLATGTTVISQGVWYYIELKFSIHPSAGTVLMQLNGATETLTYVTGTSTTQNTRSTANTQWNGFQMNDNNWNFWLDDLYLLDTSTGTNTTFLGPIRVAVLYPSAPGNYAQWTSNGGSNMGCVSEPYEDGDGSFNQSSTANQIDSYVMDDLPIGSGTVYAVQHVMVVRQDSGGPRTVAPLLRISSTDYAGTSQSLSTSYQFNTQIYDQSPATSSAWSVSEVAGLESGYKILS